MKHTIELLEITNPIATAVVASAPSMGHTKRLICEVCHTWGRTNVQYAVTSNVPSEARTYQDLQSAINYYNTL